MHAFIFLLLTTTLIWAASVVPQINPHGIVLDFKNLPKAEQVIAELKPKVEAELTPEEAAQFFKDLDKSTAYAQKAQDLLQQPEWKPACARLLWLKSFGVIYSHYQIYRQLLFKSIEHGDFQLLKDYIDYADNDYDKLEWISPYFEKYGLMHAQHIRQDLRNAFAEWRSYRGPKYGYGLAARLIAYQLSDYSLNHKFKRFATYNPTRDAPPVEIKLQFVAMHVAYGGEEDILHKLKAEPSEYDFIELDTLEKLCIAYGVPNYEAKLQEKAGIIWTLFKASDPTAEMLEEALRLAYFNVKDYYSMSDILANHNYLVDILYKAFQKNQSWFAANFPKMPIALQLLTAFFHPSVIPQVNLPAEMPRIEQMLSSRLVWSFEKAEYFQFLFEKYGDQKVCQEILRRRYPDDVMFHLGVMTDTKPIIPLMFIHLMPADLTEDEKEAWWLFFTRRGEPISMPDSQLHIFNMKSGLAN